MLFIQSSSLPLEHKAPTNPLQPSRSWASHSSSFQVFPISFISFSTDLLQVPRGLPLFLFPGGAHLSATFGNLPFFILSMCHLHLLRFTSSTMLLIPVLLLTSLLVTCCSQRTLRIQRKPRPSKPLSRLSIVLLVLQVSEVYRRTERTYNIRPIDLQLGSGL